MDRFESSKVKIILSPIAEHQWHFAKTMPKVPHRCFVNLVNNRELFLPLH